MLIKFLSLTISINTMAIASQNEQILHINTNKIYALLLVRERGGREREIDRVYNYANRAAVGESREADFSASLSYAFSGLA